MARQPSAPPLADVYTTVWKTCYTLWPLFLIQFVFIFLKYAVLLIGLLVLFGPFLEKYGHQLLEGFKHPNNLDWTLLAGDWASYFTDPTWIEILVGFVLLYATWWGLLSAVSDGGVFGTFCDFFQSGKLFSLKEFFQNGLRFLVPMIWLQILLFLIVMAVLMAWCFLVFLGIGFGFLLSGHSGIIVLLGVFLGIPMVLFWIVFALVFAVYGFVCKACLTNGMSPLEAVKEAFRRFIENRWHVGIGLIVAFLTYIVLSVVIRVTLGVLGMIPIIGFFFSVLDFFIGVGLAILLVVYLPGLSVALLSEKEV